MLNVWGNPNSLPDSVLGTAYSYDNFGFNPGSPHDGIGGILFALGQNTVTDDGALTSGVASHIYAVNGDITGLGYGQVFVKSTFAGNSTVDITSYRAAKTVNIMAGGDIANIRAMILQNDPADISTIAASGSVIYAGVNPSVGQFSQRIAGLQVAGPGTLEVTAGKNLYEGSIASIESIGALVTGDNRLGASVLLQAGVGPGTPGEGQIDWTGFAKLYLNPGNLAGSGSLADQPGKIVKTYNSELIGWLKSRFGYTGLPDDALAYFLALPAEQQRVFLRIVYYAELTAGGREFNEKNGPRTGSYLRGREAVAALFPNEEAYNGNITIFSASSGTPGAANFQINSGYVHTDFGGDIQLLAPGGGVTIGSEGLAPGADSGLITQGNGNIQIYSQDSILLGLSRIMTTFGGDILAWSNEGDINAGRGSKTTVVFTPPRVVYDDYGNISLAPVAPSTGAGIAALNRILACRRITSI